MAQASDDFGHFLTSSDAHSTQFKMRAFSQRHIDIEPLISAASEQEKCLAARTFGDVDMVTLDIDLVRGTCRNALINRMRRTRLDNNLLRLGQSPQPGQHFGRRIAPFFIASGGKRERGHLLHRHPELFQALHLRPLREQ